VCRSSTGSPAIRRAAPPAPSPPSATPWTWTYDPTQIPSLRDDKESRARTGVGSSRTIAVARSVASCQRRDGTKSCHAPLTLFVQTHVTQSTPAHLPFAVRLRQHRPHQAQHRALVRKNPHHARASLHLFVQPFQWVVRPNLRVPTASSDPPPRFCEILWENCGFAAPTHPTRHMWRLRGRLWTHETF